MKRKYEHLTLTQIPTSIEESVLYASAEVTDCSIQPMKVEVTEFENATNDWKDINFEAK